MREPGQRTSFADQPPAGDLVVDRLGQELERDPTIELLIVGRIHHARATLTELLEHPKLAEPLVHPWSECLV